MHEQCLVGATHVEGISNTFQPPNFQDSCQYPISLLTIINILRWTGYTTRCECRSLRIYQALCADTILVKSFISYTYLSNFICTNSSSEVSRAAGCTSYVIQNEAFRRLQVSTRGTGTRMRKLIIEILQSLLTRGR